MLTFILVSAFLFQILVYTDLTGADAKSFHRPFHYISPYQDNIDHITITPKTPTVVAGQWQTFSLTAYDKCGNKWDISTCQQVTWSINSEEGTYTWSNNSVKVTKAGTWTITASYRCKSDAATLTVTPGTDQSGLSYLSISPNKATITAGSSQTFTATAYDSLGNSWDVTENISTQNGWNISLDAGGNWIGSTYTSEKAGVWTITANYFTKTATATLNVTHQMNPNSIAYITASVNPESIAAPETTIGLATAYDSFGNSWDISTIANWSILEENDGGSWTQNIYTSRNAGVYTVQASYEDKSSTTYLTVTHATNQAYIDHINITPKESTVNAGTPQIYTAIAYDTFGNSWSISAVYSCASPNIKISENSAYANITGTYIITGTYEDKSDTAKLNVIGHLPTIISVSVSPKTASITAGSSISFTATASDGYNEWDVTSQVTWSINSDAGGSWDQKVGEYTSAKAGNWEIKATLNSLSDTAALTVTATITANPELLAYISISPKTRIISAGNSQNYSVSAYDEFGNNLGDVTATTRFNVPGASVIGNSVTANMVGNYTVTATYSGLTDSSDLKVVGYTIKFIQKGLQHGTSWSIRFGGQVYSSSTSAITITNVSALTYYWSIDADIIEGQSRYVTTKTSGSILVPSQSVQYIEYSKQYLVSYQTTGNALSVPVPTSEWVNTGEEALGSFPNQITNQAQNTQCNFMGDDRPQTITQPTLITGRYLTQYKVTIQQAGIQSEVDGTIVTIEGSPKNYSNLPDRLWVNNGTQLTFKFEATVISSTTEQAYSLSNVNTISPVVIDKPTIIQGNYLAQSSTSLFLQLLFIIVSFIILLTVISLFGYRRQRMKKEQSIDKTANKF